MSDYNECAKRKIMLATSLNHRRDIEINWFGGEIEYTTLVNERLIS